MVWGNCLSRKALRTWKSESKRFTRHFIGKVSMVIIWLYSLTYPAMVEVMYWVTWDTKQLVPVFSLRTVSWAIRVWRLFMTELDLRRFIISSNNLAVLVSRRLFLLVIP